MSKCEVVILVLLLCRQEILERLTMSAFFDTSITHNLKSKYVCALVMRGRPCALSIEVCNLGFSRVPVRIRAKTIITQ